MRGILVFLFSLTAFAQSYYQTAHKGFRPVCDNVSNIEIKNLPPVRDQGSYGLCFAHSGMLLLEHLRCSSNANPTECYQKQGSVLQLAQFQYGPNSDRIGLRGGDPRRILNNFTGVQKLVTEKCAPYEVWKKLDGLYPQQIKDLMSKQSPSERSEVDFFFYVYRKTRSIISDEELSCYANDLVKAGLNQSFKDIMSILKSNISSAQGLRYRMLVPKGCGADTIAYPAFSKDQYPNGEKASPEGFKNFVFRYLSAGHPVEASFKTDLGAHSLTIVGQRYVCNQERCELQFRLQNSYGLSWQTEHDNGWVNADNIISRMSEADMGLTAILPAGKTINSALKAPEYKSSPVGRTPFSSANNCYKVASTPVTLSSKGGAGIWKCTKNGRTEMSQIPIDGFDCKKL